MCDKYKIIPEIAAEALVKILQQINSGNNAEFEVWVSNTFYYLKKIALGNSNAIESLIQLVARLKLQYLNDDEYLCELAIETLGIIGRHNNNAINFLSNFSRSNYSEELRCLAARALWYIDWGNTTALDICIQLLESKADPFTKNDAALLILKGYLAESITTEETNKAIASILQTIKNNSQVDYKTVIRLGEVSIRNNTAKETLFEILEICQVNWSRIHIATTILKLDSKNQKALNTIYKVIETEEEDWRHYNAVKSLLEIDPDNQIAFDALSKLLATATHEHTRLEIAKKLALKDSSNKLAVDILRELIYIPSLYHCIDERDLPLSVLEQIDPSKKLAIKALEEFARKTKDQDALIYIIKNLQRLDPGNNTAQQKLNRIIAAVISSMKTYDPDDEGSLLNVLIYGRGIKSSQLLPEAVIALKPYLNHKSSTNREIACMMIWKCAKKMSYTDFYRAWQIKADDN